MPPWWFWLLLARRSRSQQGNELIGYLVLIAVGIILVCALLGTIFPEEKDTTDLDAYFGWTVEGTYR